MAYEEEREGSPDDICLPILCSKNEPRVAVPANQNLSACHHRLILLSFNGFLGILSLMSALPVSSVTQLCLVRISLHTGKVSRLASAQERVGHRILNLTMILMR